MPQKKLLVFLDIDGTLIQKNQRTNSNILPRIIKRLSKRGFLFGLNSNRSLEDVQLIYTKFGLNGPLVLENGTYFKRTLTDKEIFLIAKHPNISQITRVAIESFAKINNLNATIALTDTVKIIKNEKWLKTIAQGIFANCFRKYSGSVHLFKYGQRDLVTAKKLGKYLKSYFAKNNLRIDIEIPRYSDNIVFWPRGCDKGTALKKLKKYYPNYSFAMVGDDLADLKTLGQLQYFFAVANAQAEVKRVANFVSKRAYTQGVIDILNHLEKTYADTTTIQQ